MSLTYSKAGVDIEKKAISAKKIISSFTFTRNGLGKPIKLPFHFTGLVDFGNFALTLCTDGVGSKILVAKALNKWDTIGIDCIAMNVNDTICVGAEPISFVDYLAVEYPDAKIAYEIGKGLSEGARQARISIVGGETAILPEIVNCLDLSGSCLGFVKKEEIITGKKIKVGDEIIGLGSTGIHSNGLTLARKVFENSNISYHDKLPYLSLPLGKILLEPTKIYVREIMEVLKKYRKKISGLANITGGGLRNIPRLKKKVKYVIDSPIKPHKIFELIQDYGKISDKEMYQTFNMGMGFCIICRKDITDEILNTLKDYYQKEGKKFGKKIEVKIVGRVEEGVGVTLPSLGISFKKAKC